MHSCTNRYRWNHFCKFGNQYISISRPVGARNVGYVWFIFLQLSWFTPYINWLRFWGSFIMKRLSFKRMYRSTLRWFGETCGFRTDGDGLRISLFRFGQSLESVAATLGRYEMLFFWRGGFQRKRSEGPFLRWGFQRRESDQIIYSQPRRATHWWHCERLHWEAGGAGVAHPESRSSCQNQKAVEGVGMQGKERKGNVWERKRSIRIERGKVRPLPPPYSPF